MTELTPRQARFVQEYLIDLNGKEAATRAGYVAKSAAIKASKLLARPHVRAAVQAAIEERKRVTSITAERVLDEIAVIAFADIKDYVVIDGEGNVKPKRFGGMPAGASRAICSVGEGSAKGGGVLLSFKMHDKMKALDMLAKHLGICKEQLELGGKVSTDGVLTIKVVKTT